jgi:predicted GNAT family acetyltransferase
MNNTETSTEKTDLYTIEFQHRPKYLYAYVTGSEINLEIVKDYCRKILEECRKHGFDKILIEQNIEASLSMQEVYEFSSEFPSMGFREMFVAFVDRYPSHRQVNVFGELVATNRGSRARVCDTVTEAKQWLLTR